jgi:hypothetical protein
MYLCVLNQEGMIILHRDIRTNPDIFLKTIAPYREDIVVAVECIFTWYWIADLCFCPLPEPDTNWRTFYA